MEEIGEVKLGKDGAKEKVIIIRKNKQQKNEMQEEKSKKSKDKWKRWKEQTNEEKNRMIIK